MTNEMLNLIRMIDFLTILYTLEGGGSRALMLPNKHAELDWLNPFQAWHITMNRTSYTFIIHQPYQILQIVLSSNFQS